MPYKDLRSFLNLLERRGDLKRISARVDPRFEITEVCLRTLKNNGPALLFNNPGNNRMPLLGNLFGSPRRIAAALERESVSELREIGTVLAFLREPEWPAEIGALFDNLPAFRKLLHLSPRVLSQAPCLENTLEGDEVNLENFPIQTCWPEDAGPLLTWGLVITKGPNKSRQNIGVYRQQLIARNKLIMRWLPHRGGAIDYREWCAIHPEKRFPVAVAIGADPATILAAVAPIPDTIPELQFAGLLRGARSEVVDCACVPLQVPANAESPPTSKEDSWLLEACSAECRALTWPSSWPRRAASCASFSRSSKIPRVTAMEPPGNA